MKLPLRLSLFVLVFVFSGCLLSANAGRVPGWTESKPPEAAATSPADGAFAKPAQFMIPGPLRSFLRMAGISQKVTPEEVLPLLSRNVFMQGYQSTSKTEFLILLSRYVVQARELSLLVANDGKIHVSNCDDAKPLLTILGYRTRPQCGQPGTSLQTADSERAFLTIDSGFPLPQLEQALQGGKPFEYPYASSAVPVLFAPGDWTMASRNNHNEASKDLIDTILIDPAVARLYWALSKLDPDTDNILQQSMGLGKLLPYAAVLDFYGSRISIRGGRVVVPGGSEAESAWKEFVGVSPASPAAFVQRLLASDKGWLAAYFDVLSSVSRSRQAYFTEPHRLRLFYEALRTKHSTGATIGLMRPSPGLQLLVTCLQWDPNGEPLVPGNLEVWRDILLQKNASHVMDKRNAHLTGPDQLVQTMFALSRQSTYDGPLQIYMAISAIENQRSPEHRLAPATVGLLAQKFDEFRDQYRIFSEFPELNDTSITSFLETAQTLNTVPSVIRADALGIFQANAGMWQILARQGQIPTLQLNDSWQQMIKPFAKVRTAAQLYDAGRTSLTELFRSASSETRRPQRVSQDEIIESLAGPQQITPEGIKIHKELATRIRSVLDGQRLVSVDTLLALGDALKQKGQGKPLDDFVLRKAGEIHEFEMPRPIFTNTERTEWASGIYNNHHTDVQMRTDLAKVLKSPSPSSAQLEEARGQLASFLRDTLVGLNYAYYEPPGSEALHSNPLLVRSHDFAAETIGGIKTVWQTPELLGQGSPAGGGAHFVGSLADLPYVLAELEQDFITPENVQALIWKDLTPALLTSAILPRWWNVSPAELHAVALYQRSGEELLKFSARNKDDDLHKEDLHKEDLQKEALRSKVITILSDRVSPRRSMQVEQALLAGDASLIVPPISPADTFYLTAEFHRRYPEETASWGPATQELQLLSRQHPEQVSWKRLSHDFGVPHPLLAQTYGSELMNIGPLPTYAGYSSRLLAESWDSPNLYWARLADESGLSAVALNHLAPQLTRAMIEKIFATDLEDWEALLRAMQETAEEFRNTNRASLNTGGGAQP